MSLTRVEAWGNLRGVSHIGVYKDEDGVDWLLKAYGHEYELIAALVADSIGTPVPPWRMVATPEDNFGGYDAPECFASQWLNDFETLAQRGIGADSWLALVASLDNAPKQFARIHLLDLLIANADRHSSNLGVVGSTVTAIDHGLSSFRGGRFDSGYWPNACWGQMVSCMQDRKHAARFTRDTKKELIKLAKGIKDTDWSVVLAPTAALGVYAPELSEAARIVSQRCDALLPEIHERL